MKVGLKLLDVFEEFDNFVVMNGSIYTIPKLTAMKIRDSCITAISVTVRFL